MMEGGGRIVIVGTFDTKGEEHAHLRRCIQQVPVTPNLAFVLSWHKHQDLWMSKIEQIFLHVRGVAPHAGYPPGGSAA